MARKAPPGGDRPSDQVHHERLSMAQPLQQSTHTDTSHSFGNLPNSQVIIVGISEKELSRAQQIISLFMSGLIHVIPMGDDDSSKNDLTNTQNLDNSNVQNLDIRKSSFQMRDMGPNGLDSPGPKPSNGDHGPKSTGETDRKAPFDDGDGAPTGFVGQVIPQLVPGTMT